MKLLETLAQELKTEPKTKASAQARKLGLRYMGFGRYAGKDGKVLYVVHDDKLVPYKAKEDIYKEYNKAEDLEMQAYDEKPQPGENTKLKPGQDAPYKKKLENAKNLKKNADNFMGILKKRESQDNSIKSEKKKQVQKYDSALRKMYKREMFTPDEHEAIHDYCGNGYVAINDYLYKGHQPGVIPTQAKYVHQRVAQLDSAFDQTEIPIKVTAYTGLSDRYKPENFKVGSTYVFKGFVSTSLDYEVSLEGFANEQSSAKSKQPVKVLLQVEVPAGSKAIYLDALSQGEKELLLHRGSHIKVISGPHYTPEEAVMGEADPWVDAAQVVLFHCELVHDDQDE